MEVVHEGRAFEKYSWEAFLGANIGGVIEACVRDLHGRRT